MLERIKYIKQEKEQIAKYYKIRYQNIVKINEDSKEQVEREVHDTYYSYLLFDYILNVRKTLKQKRILKIIFFIVVMLIFVLTFFWFSLFGSKCVRYYKVN